MQTLTLNFRGKKIKISANRVSPIGKFLGLMFKSSKTPNLLFELSKLETKAIHSIFVFFPFLAIWLDNKNNVVDFKYVKPFTPIVNPKKAPSKLIELPANQANSSVLDLFIRRQRKDLNKKE